MEFKNEKLAKVCCILVNICVAIWIFIKFHLVFFKEFSYFILSAVSTGAVIWTFYPIQTMEFINNWITVSIKFKVYIAIILFIMIEVLMVGFCKKGFFAKILNENYLYRFCKVIKNDEYFEIIGREKLSRRNAKIVAIVKKNYQRIEIDENEVAKEENGVISIFDQGNENAKEIIPVKNTILFEYRDMQEKVK